MGTIQVVLSAMKLILILSITGFATAWTNYTMTAGSGAPSHNGTLYEPKPRTSAGTCEGICGGTWYVGGPFAYNWDDDYCVCDEVCYRDNDCCDDFEELCL